MIVGDRHDFLMKVRTRKCTFTKHQRDTGEQIHELKGLINRDRMPRLCFPLAMP